MSAGKFSLALSALASLNVPGINHNYDVPNVPDRVTRASAPALLVFPMLDTLVKHKYSEFIFSTPTASNALVSYYATHLLLVSPGGYGKGVRSNLPNVVDLLDSYANTVRANPRLNNTLFRPTEYVVFVEPITYGGLTWMGARLLHKLTVEV